MDADALKMRSKSALQASGVSRYNATRFWSVLASICVSEAEALTYERGGHFVHSINVFYRARSRHTRHWKHVLPSSQCAYGTLTVTKSPAHFRSFKLPPNVGHFRSLRPRVCAKVLSQH